MATVNRWTVGWIVWLAAFLVWELLAATQAGTSTLSEHVWVWFSFKCGWLVVTIAMAYLTWHFARGAWQRGKR